MRVFLVRCIHLVLSLAMTAQINLLMVLKQCDLIQMRDGGVGFIGMTGGLQLANRLAQELRWLSGSH
jgi:hypothetical protein